MSSILNIAVSGLNAATARFANIANNIANASTPNFKRQEVVTQSNAANGVGLGATTVTRPAADDSAADVTGDLVASIAVKTDYAANAAVIKTVKKLDKALLDIQA